MKKLSNKIFRFAKSRLGEPRARAIALKIKKLRYLAKPRPVITVGQAIALGDNSLYLQGQIVDIRHLIRSIELVFAGGNSLRIDCLLYTSPSPRDGLLSRMPSSA